MTKPTPLQAVNSQYGGKEKLIDSVVAVAKDDDEDTAEAKERLQSVSNKKLLRLARVAQELKDKYGGKKDKLIEALVAAQGRSKDGDYIEKLGTLSTARLIDMMRAASKPN